MPLRPDLPALALVAAATSLFPSAAANGADAKTTVPPAMVREAEAALRQSFQNLSFEQFAPSPIKGPVYQAMAGGRLVYFAPNSGHLIFAALFDKAGTNLTARAEAEQAARHIKALDLSQAMKIGPEGAPRVIEFTDPDCPYCQALDRYWAVKAAEGKVVQRLVFFVTGMHPLAAAKAEHILCSKDPAGAFKAIYGGATPKALATCASGKARLADQDKIVAGVSLTGTPTLILDGRFISGFQQAELETWLGSSRPERRP